MSVHSVCELLVYKELNMKKRFFAPLLLGVALLSMACSSGAAPLSAISADQVAPLSQKTTTPIKHVVVIFQENVSFDHYFATYPKATNPAGDPRFVARRGTPTVNGL